MEECSDGGSTVVVVNGTLARATKKVRRRLEDSLDPTNPMVDDSGRKAI